MQIPRYFEDPHTLHVGTMPNRAYYVPDAPAEGPRLYPAEWMEDSRRALYLSGADWQFRYETGSEDIPPDFFKPDFTAGAENGFAAIQVPGCWQTQGYDRHQYTNVRNPFPYDPPYVPAENPAGAYRKTFILTEERAACESFLYFEGVDSCFYVWVNGAFVGYSQVSHSSSEFRVTEWVRPGENLVAVLVLKWCDGSYLEDQDKFRMSGIFRDVYLLFRPTSHIRDFFVHADVQDFSEDGRKGPVSLSIDLEWFGEPRQARASLFGPDNVLLQQTQGEASLGFRLEDASLWTAETPVQYTVVLETGQEAIAQKVGFRKVEIRGAVIYLNGRKVKLKGVNRHDSDPVTGYTISRAQMQRDLQLMKAHNVNAIRTSHYPNAPWAPKLFAEYGFYVIAEADLETHGTTAIYGGGAEAGYYTKFLKDRTYGLLSHDPRFEQAMLDRSQRNVTRDKNCAAILFWSLGNEAAYGPNLEKAAAWVKAYDPSRLVHYESSIYQMEGEENDLTNIDVHSRMYAPVEAIDFYFTEAYQKEHRKPFLECEYCHAMGNGPGDLEDYFTRMEKYDGFAGAFVWEWCDHAVFKGRTNDGKCIYGYGGDFGEFPHDGNFCVDGLVYPDRTPHTGLLEFRNVMRPLRVSAVEDAGDSVLVSLKNQLNFLNASEAVSASWELAAEGIVVQKGFLPPLDIPAGETRAVRIPCRTGRPGSSSLRLVYRQKGGPFPPEGTFLGFDQAILREVPFQDPAVPAAAGAFVLREDARRLEISGPGFRHVFHKQKGVFQELCIANRPLLDRPMEWNLWRAPTDNDAGIAAQWREAGYDRTTVRVYSVDKEVKPEGVCLRVRFAVSAVSLQRILDGSACWHIAPDGSVRVTARVKRDPSMPYLPRFGLRLFLPSAFSQVEYLGYGPYESYVDKHRASWLGRFASPVSRLHEDYLRPQENSSHWGCRWVELSDGGNARFRAESPASFSMNASLYTQEELTLKRHAHELVPCGSTVLCLDGYMSGIGSASCGPELAESYRVDGEELSLDFLLSCRPQA